MGRTQVAICLFFFFASACEAANCSSFTDACPSREVKFPHREISVKSRPPGEWASYSCAGSKCTALDCCGKTCLEAFTGKCAATQVVDDSKVYYGQHYGQTYGQEIPLNWSYAGNITDMEANWQYDSCCKTTCGSAKKITCASGRSMKSGGRERCVGGGQDKCGSDEECCEPTTCVHSTCDAVTGGFEVNCRPNCREELNDLNAERVNAAATCVSTKGLDKTGCYNCVKCYDGLHLGGKMTVGPPVKGATSSAWSSRCLASALLVGGGLFGMTA